MNKIKSKLRIRRDGGSTETETGIKYSRLNACAWPIYGTAATIKIYLVDSVPHLLFIFQARI